MPSTQAGISMGQLMVLVVVSALGLAVSPRDIVYVGLFLPVALGLAWLRLWPIAVPAILFLVLLALVEIVLAEPVAGWIYAPIAVLISGPLWPEGPDRWRSRRAIPLIAVNALILALFLVPWSTRKPFLHHLYSIKPGMTEADVVRIMAGYKERTYLTHSNAGREALYTFRHSDNGFFNADLGVVTIRDGKVVDIRFLPD
jgi:hypothetical protein